MAIRASSLPATEPRHHHYRQRYSISSSSTYSDDDDAITPAEDEPVQPAALPPMMPTCATVAVVEERNSTLHRWRRSTTSSLSSLFSRYRFEALSRGAPSAGPTWHFDPADGEDLDTARLWRRMLALQRRFHCYRSARMSAALDNSAVEAMVPPRACLDMLNESIPKLPDETLREVEAFIGSRRYSDE